VTPSPPLGWSTLLRQDVIHVLSGYLVVMAMLFSRRAPARRRAEPVGTGPVLRGWPPTWRGLVRYLINTAIGGYAVFLLIVVVFYFILGGEGFGFIRDALTGGVWLSLGLAVPCLLAIAWIEERLARWRSGARQGHRVSPGAPNPTSPRSPGLP